MINKVQAKTDVFSPLIRLLLLFALFGSLTACGFHLRGLDSSGQVRPLPFSTLKLETLGQVDGRLLQQLKHQLKARSVRLVLSETQAEVVLKLSATAFKRIVTAENAQNQVTAELLKLQQPYTLVSVETGKVLVQGVALSYQDRSIDPQALLAAERELASQQQIMRFEVVQQIMQRLNAMPALFKKSSYEKSSQSFKSDLKSPAPLNEMRRLAV